MKVLLVNGSQHEKGTTFAALSEAAAELERAGVEAEIFWPSTAPIQPCLACGGCHKGGKCRCVFDDSVNKLIEKAEKADGFIFGSPVHYASCSGLITTLLDRAFYAGGAKFQYKPGAAVVCCRRGGASAAFDQLNKYFTISKMPIVSSQYWNMVYGNSADEAKLDEEGMQCMRTLARNMAWLLKCIEAGKAAGVPMPEIEDRRAVTNFIR